QKVTRPPPRLLQSHALHGLPQDLSFHQHGAKDGFELITQRQSSKVPAGGDESARRGRNTLRRQRKLPMRREKLGDDVLILLGLTRAGRVDKTAAWVDDLGDTIEHLRLHGGET